MEYTGCKGLKIYCNLSKLSTDIIPEFNDNTLTKYDPDERCETSIVMQGS